MKKILHDFKQSFIEEFSSVRLAITLFIFLAITTLIGTILPEEPMVGTAKLVEKYGRDNYLFLKSLGFTDVFHSWWYLALMTSLGLNLIIASVQKVFPRAKRAFIFPPCIKEENIKKLPVNCEVEIKNDLDLSTIQNKLKEKKYSIKVENKRLSAMKGAWHRLGASVTHVGILTLLFGSAISILTGFNGMAQVAEDEGFYIADLGQNTTQIKSIERENWLAPISKMPIWIGRIPPYLVKVNKTWRVDYKSGQPKQWFSDLSILDQNKKELSRKTIHVNDPFEFRGLDIYQSNWGKFTEITFNNNQISLPVENFRNEDVAIIPLSNDIGLKLKPVKDSKSSDILELYSIALDKTDFEKFLGSVGRGKTIKVGPINIGYIGTKTFTGLQFKSNPGDILIYPGLFFIILGVFIAFGSKKQIWATINSTNTKIVIGGNADRAKGKFFEEFENLILEISANKK